MMSVACRGGWRGCVRALQRPTPCASSGRSPIVSFGTAAATALQRKPWWRPRIKRPDAHRSPTPPRSADVAPPRAVLPSTPPSSSSSLFSPAPSRSVAVSPSSSPASSDDTIRGSVSRVIFRSKESGYTILKLSRDDETAESLAPPSDVICLGVLSEARPGLRLSLRGEWTETERFGRQFAFSSASFPTPTSVSDMQLYLAATLPGIGPAIAQRVVERFGERTFAVLDEGGAELLKVKGINAKKLSAVMHTWVEQATQRATALFFAAHGITPRQGEQLVDEYGEDVVAVVQRSPYVVVEIVGFGFAKADALGQKLGFSLTSSQRVQGGLQYQLMEAMQGGHTFMQERELVQGALALLNEKGAAEEERVTEAQVILELLAMVDSGAVVRENVAGHSRAWTWRPEAMASALSSPSSLPTTSPAQAVALETFFGAAPPAAAEPAGKAITSSQSLGPPVIAYFSRRAWQLELQLSQHIQRLLSPAAQSPRQQFLRSRHITPLSLSSWMSSYETAQRITFTLEQRQAIRTAILGAVTVVTGVPGSGKTFLLKALTQFWTEHSVEFLLTSPTGRGAQRMEESTGIEAMTCHRALRWVTKARFIEEVAKREGGGEAEGRAAWKRQKLGMELMGRSTGTFMMSRSNPLHQHAYVVDEVSMMDLPLVTALFTALPSSAHLILVGDPDQLPSVGVGNVLRDLISSGAVPVMRLTEQLRQLTESTLHLNVRAVNAGRMPQLHEVHPEAGAVSVSSDSLFIRETPDPVPTLQHLVKTLLPSVGVNPLTEMQVLSPIKRGPSGTHALNAHLQALLNPSTALTPSISHHGSAYRVGDRVMQQQNDYEREVYNGDIGRVSALELDAGALSVDFPHRRVRYVASELDSITLAWAITVHKSQGSEYRAVVLFVCQQHHIMLFRSLLYTAVSRARNVLVVVGDQAAMARGVWNKDERSRTSALRIRIRRALGMSLD